MKYFLPAVLWAAFIFFLSSGSAPQMPKFWWEELFAPDKLGHAVVYGILCLSLIYGFQKYSEQSAEKTLYWALGISILYGILMEIMQYCFFPNRYFEIFDIIANIIGSISAPFIFRKKIVKKV